MANTKSQLAKYRAKRDFKKTAEPSGDAKVAPSERLRFVVQKHAATRLHYDLRLELDGVFKSWAVTKGPSLDPANKRLAVEVEDHPLEYGDFEGTIAAGQYGAGTVQLWDRGYWQPDGARPAQEMLAKGDLKFQLDGERLRGGWVLVRMRNDKYRSKRNNWLLIKHRDEFARPADDVLLEQDASVASDRSMAAIAAGQGRKVRCSCGIQGHDFPIDYTVRQFRTSLHDFRKFSAPVQALAGAENTFTGFDSHLDPVSVELDLMAPARTGRGARQQLAELRGDKRGHPGDLIDVLP